jgi:anthranilate phosphoribosyltransferase
MSAAAVSPPSKVVAWIRSIGRGREGARSLEQDDARALMAALLGGELAPVEVGALLLALRMKGEAAAELRGFLQALPPHLLPLELPSSGSAPVVCIPSYNGARRLPNLVALLAMLLAREGLRVLVHGVESDPGRVSTAEVFCALGLPKLLARHLPPLALYDAPAERGAVASRAIADAWAMHEPVFVSIDALSPALARLLALRRTLGVRNCGHTVVKMLDPFAARPARAPQPRLRLVSFTHPEFQRQMAEAFVAEPEAQVLLMRGTEGEAVADARRSQPIEHIGGGQRRLLVEAQGGVLTSVPALPADIDAATTASYIQRLMSGEAPVPLPIERQVQAVAEVAAALAAAPDAAAPVRAAAGGARAALRAPA